MQKHLHIFSRRILLESQVSPLLATPCACDPRSGSSSSSIRVWPPAASIPGTRSFSGAQCRGLIALYSEPSRRSVRGPLTCCLPVIIRQIAGGKRGGERVEGIILSAGWSCMGRLWVTAPWRWNPPVQSLSWPCIMEEAQLLLPLALLGNNFSHQPLGSCLNRPHLLLCTVHCLSTISLRREASQLRSINRKLNLNL